MVPLFDADFAREALSIIFIAWKAKQPILPRLLVIKISFYLLIRAYYVSSRAKISLGLSIILDENR